MALNAWQKLDRVLPGMPFGDGLDGSNTLTGLFRPVMTSAEQIAGATTLDVADGTDFPNGTVILIHQSRGTGVGQWEINRILSGGTTTTWTLYKALQYTFTDDGGANQAQAVRLYRYVNVTVSSSINVGEWDGDKYGILPFAVKGVLTPATITATGNVGAPAAGGGGSGGSGGYRGGAGRRNSNTTLYATQGESTTAVGSELNTANVGGGGGGRTSGSGGEGGGGGHATAGTLGQELGSTGGAAGAVNGGNTGLTEMIFGSGGGGGGNDAVEPTGGGGGGAGGGIILIYAKNILAPTSIISAGGNGGAGPENDGGGGGAGGSILLVAQTIDLGTDKISVVGGAGSGSANGSGDGGKGRIAVYYGQTLTGSIDASLYGSLTSEKDPTLTEIGGAHLLLAM